MAKKLYYEVPGGGTITATTALTDSGDNTTFNAGTTEFISAFQSDALGIDSRPTVLVDGCISGGIVTPAVSGTNDLVDASALTANIDGTAYKGATILSAGTDLSCPRGAGAPTKFIIHSITHTGSAWAVVSGTGHTSQDLTGRGGNGQPPYIPVGSIEVAQVRYTDETPAPVASAGEIFMNPNESRELANNPGKTVEYARVTNKTQGYAGVTFKAALTAIHTGDIPRAVWMTWTTPSFAEWQGANNVQFQGDENTSTSTTTYSGTRSYASVGIVDGTFDWEPESVVTDTEWDVMGGSTWFKLYENASDTSFLAYQGIPGAVPLLPESGPIETPVTLTGGTAYVRIWA